MGGYCSSLNWSAIMIQPNWSKKIGFCLWVLPTKSDLLCENYGSEVLTRFNPKFMVCSLETTLVMPFWRGETWAQALDTLTIPNWPLSVLYFWREIMGKWGLFVISTKMKDFLGISSNMFYPYVCCLLSEKSTDETTDKSEEKPLFRVLELRRCKSIETVLASKQ